MGMLEILNEHIDRFVRFSDQEDYRIPLLKLIRVVGIPALSFFTIVDLFRGKPGEAVSVFLVFLYLLFFEFIEKKINADQYMYRIGVFVLAWMLFYGQISSPDIQYLIFWWFLIPLLSSFLLGVFEGLIWILVSGIIQIALQIYLQRDIEFILWFVAAYIILSLITQTQQ